MEQNREQTISRVTAWGAVGNLVLAAFKLLAGVVGRSSAMLADAVHSLSDLVSDVIVIVMVKVSSKAADDDHAYGHGKYETLATMAVSLLLLVVGAKLMAEGVEKIRIVASGRELPMPGSVALWAAIVSIVVKEVLYQWTARVGKRVNSPAMISNAWHHRTDALSSIASALGIGAALAFGGQWVILDPVVACLISIFIIVVAVKMALPALHELTEGALPAETEKQIISIISAVPGVDNVHGLKTRKNGPSFIISAHVVVNPSMSVAEAHHITVLAEQSVRRVFGKETQISIHIEPDENSL
ncbi:MAG: cation diffusion facilitator family transporter [Bacteroidales bacterium]|nr:cation diffusion facilitator family transporter [Bacteroidales bacterium]